MLGGHVYGWKDLQTKRKVLPLSEASLEVVGGSERERGTGLSSIP